MLSSLRAGSAAPSRPGLRTTTKRASTVRQQHHPLASSFSSATSSSTAAAAATAATSATRFGRPGAISPADSLLSFATTATATAGTKRKERDYEGDGAVVGGEETNINVVVRCRGRNEREVRENSAVVVNTDGAKGKTVELLMGPNALSNKTYNFDRVFSPAADQSMLFDDVVKPILDETGTGKTYTMSGDMSEALGLLTDAAGIIPRVLQSLFNKLELDESDSIVRCSFIELYNEELRDLLSADSDTAGGNSNSNSNKLKIYDDNSRRGHATTVVQGMEERHISSAAEGIKRLQEGSLRRQVAATKCNDLSSRSHTVFTITVQTKHVTENGEDFVSTGKLNLVDLAGSENIQRSGAENKRAAEAGLINKSLLTLGRVINALVDRTAHVPYRESKLTRLLQDSLGGRTKTCIIATISTAKSNLEETISTLDYAFRAKNIRNKPQVNQLLNKKTLLREFTAEIEKLKSELIVTRQRNGVYLANDAYEEMTVQSESRRILAEEQAARIETMERNLRNKLQELLDLTSNFMGLKKEHEGTKGQLDTTRSVLDETERVLAATRTSLAEEHHIRRAHQATEQTLATLGGELLATLHRTVGDIDGLRAKNRRKSDLQGVNRNTWAGAQAHVAEVTRLVEARIHDLRTSQDRHVANIAQRMQVFVAAEQQSLSATQALLDDNLAAFDASKGALLNQRSASADDLSTVLAEIRGVRQHIQERVGESLRAIASAAERIAEDVLSELGTFHEQLDASYTTLRDDCVNVMADVLEHTTSQRSEAECLRRQVESASQAAVEANTRMAAQMQETVNEERRQAAEDRQRLLAQIGDLINAQATDQEARWAAKTDVLRERLVQANASLEGSLDVYAEGMDAWNERNDKFAEDLSRARHDLITRLDDDRSAANKHSTSIQTTTKSVHAETVRVVDEQMGDLGVQMQDLDSLVTRAASHSTDHLAQHGASVTEMAEAVTTAFLDLGRHARATCGRVETMAGDAEADVDALRTSLAPVDETLRQPLSDLRACVANTTLREYVPTGDTPEKVQYRYPLELPRTAPHHVLLAQGRQNGSTNQREDADTDADDVIDGVDALDDSLSTPSRAATTTSTTAITIDATVPVIFNDADRSPRQAASSPPPPPRLSLSAHGGAGAGAGAPLSMSLREVNPNLTTALISFAPSAATTKAAASNESLSNDDENTANNDNTDHTLQPFRRGTRQQQQQQPPPPQKQAKAHRGAAMLAFEGRENVPPAAFGNSLSRRRSPRLN
ncbi:kinesin-II 85 kDa subunit [Niveomyces insectorum RCEF 264]|uniref:Kinesin-II 85 kDa subunit n=1 Tax=Niveomyces insectorum RCEF 264 TaxID=1081102 RepID=A0A167N9S3_9HYPO|nr:kinesin-II 85 kDa subunit [Niveomyces insectorum RCEF 264]